MIQSTARATVASILTAGAIVVAAVVGWRHLSARPAPFTTNEPRVGDLVGAYQTRDRRTAGATLELSEDGSFDLRGFFGRSGTGKWRVVQEPSGSRWQLQLDVAGQSGGFRVDGINLRGQAPPYSVEMYKGDPDEGGILFELVSSGVVQRPPQPGQ